VQRGLAVFIQCPEGLVGRAVVAAEAIHHLGRGKGEVEGDRAPGA
jgi:hypothetical protein